MKKKHIASDLKMNIIGLTVVVVVQCLACFLIHNILKEFFGHSMAYKIAFPIIILICIAITFNFLYNRVILLWKLLQRTPEKCKLEDIFLIPHKDNDGRTQYFPYPIVRSYNDHNLYLAYGDYSLLGFRKIMNRSDYHTIDCTLCREDGTPIMIGDDVDMYVWKTLSIPVSIDSSKNTVKLKGSKYYFYHVNNQFDIDAFRSIIFFKGCIVLDFETEDYTAEGQSDRQ